MSIKQLMPYFKIKINNVETYVFKYCKNLGNRNYNTKVNKTNAENTFY